MNKLNLQIFIEYKINETEVDQYESVMQEVIRKLPEYSAENIQWFVSTDQPNLYVEMFQVPNIAHYKALKKLRKSYEHPIFSQLDKYIEGGLDRLNCWAFQTKQIQE